jgi:hypothetical protein
MTRMEHNTHTSGDIARSMRISLFIMIVLMAFLVLDGCWHIRKEFERVTEERPIVIFENYRLDIDALAEEPYDIYCWVTFVHPSNDASHIDTIPIFRIDSFCYKGDCMDSVICFRPQSDYEWDMRKYKAGTYDRQPTYSPAKDLYFKGANLVPNSYFLPQTSGFPPTCKDRDVSILIHASLIDRRTEKIIKKEDKQVHFQIHKKFKLNIGS